MTYGTTLNFGDLFDDHQLAESIATVMPLFLIAVRQATHELPEHFSAFQGVFKIQPQESSNTHRHPSSIRNTQTSLQPGSILSPASSYLRQIHPQYPQNTHPNTSPFPATPTTTNLPHQLPAQSRSRNWQQATFPQLGPKMQRQSSHLHP